MMMVRKGTALAAMALVGTVVACSDPKPPAAQAAVEARLSGDACQSLSPSLSSISYGEPSQNGSSNRVANGELDQEVTCAAFEMGDGFRLRADIVGANNSFFVDGTLSAVTSDSDIGCLVRSNTPAGSLAGPVAVSVTVKSIGYSAEKSDGDCWVSVASNLYGSGKAKGTLCCDTLVADTAGNKVCSIVGGEFVVENCDLALD